MNREAIQRHVAATERFLVKVRRDMLDPEASKRNDNTLYVTMESGIHVLSRVYAGTDRPAECFEPEIRNIWYMFIISAQNIDVDHLAQDRLLRIITSARHRGILHKAANPARDLMPEDLGAGGPDASQLRIGESLEAAETSHGCIWVDLPFLVPDVRDAWKRLMESSASPAHCCNLTSAIARLAGSGVCGDAFSQCGLEIMKLVLETPLPPSSAVGSNTSQRLALVRIWLRYAGEVLLRLCISASLLFDSSWALDEQQPIGPLARQANIGPVAAWSQERFIFWKDRLVAMTAEAEGEEPIEALCAYSIRNIWETHFGILKD
ncbi:hypothetical protein GGR55DRAFT_643381 [Xylaria sp. FL0064]|nr:hypothetical protein GGR55DRAFT_643381 [Xylaria sp. FL0064]